LNRRELLAAAAAWGAALAVPSGCARSPTGSSREELALYPQGVASGDPYPDGAILWTRRPPVSGSLARRLLVEISADAAFRQVVAASHAPLSADSDWTCRVLAAGLQPARVYWYRFTDEQGYRSRVGRTITAPANEDGRPVEFAFVSCQNVQEGASNAYRRMIWEDEREDPDRRLGFVLHLGDFVYEVVWYPEDRPQGMYSRRLRDIVRYRNGEKHRDFHVPTTVDDYRALYRAYLSDPDLQDARARWPFVSIWDNHEFSWKGWQSQQNFGEGAVAAQARKVAANQAWFEYQPARVSKPGGAPLTAFEPPRVSDAPVRDFDGDGLGLELGNLEAIRSLTVFRTLRFGRNVELILTDNRSFRAEPLVDRPEFSPFLTKAFPWVLPLDVLEILDAGRTHGRGHPPDAVVFAGSSFPNPRKRAPAVSMLGRDQKAWFLERLRASTAVWKLWGNSVAMLDWRMDFQNLPTGLGPPWPSRGYATLGDDDWSAYRAERAEILDFIRRERIPGIASIAGDRHAFCAGVVSTELPPRLFDPVAPEFITGSISAPGLFEAAEYAIPPNLPIGPIYVHRTPAGVWEPALNVSIMHGVSASLELQRSSSLDRALEKRNAEVAPHLSHVDVGGHGYSRVRASADELRVQFVCIPRPLESSGRTDGGPVAYRVGYRAPLWRPGEPPRLERYMQEGSLPLLI
jgi:alkaline phosphatase D